MGRQTFVQGNGLVLGALDSQSLGPGSVFRVEVCHSLPRPVSSRGIIAYPCPTSSAPLTLHAEVASGLFDEYSVTATLSIRGESLCPCTPFKDSA